MTSKKISFIKKNEDLKRLQREEDRKKRDQEKAKKRLELKQKIKKEKELKFEKQEKQNPKSNRKHANKKKLLYRRAKSRYKIKISNDGNIILDDENIENNENDEKNNNNTNNIKPDTPIAGSVEIIRLSDKEEKLLDTLEETFLKADPDFWGFIEHSKFLKCIEDSSIELNSETSMYLLKSLMSFDEGIDYYGFLGEIRTIGYKKKLSVVECLEKMATKQKNIELGNNESDSDSYSDSSSNNEKEEKTNIHFGLLKSSSVRDLSPNNPIKQLINDLALDGADVDLALLKTALQFIDIYPKEKDMEFIIKYLSNDDKSDNPFVDFRQFLQFVQESYMNSSKSKEFNLSKAISYVANQLRLYVREEERRKQQQEKVKKRLEKRRSQLPNVKKNELDEILQEEKRLRALRLREKMRKY